MAIQTSRPEKIITEMPHPMAEKILELDFGNIFQQIFLEQGFTVFKIAALKRLGIYKMGQHSASESPPGGTNHSPPV
jgi:hypothetical protein